jgi:hypothetical protein
MEVLMFLGVNPTYSIGGTMAVHDENRSMRVIR